MATTDFLLRPAAQNSRNQPAGLDHAAGQGSTAALPSQNFSAVYTQHQQRIEQVQQQQAQQAKQRQAAATQDRQQAERQSAAKNTAQPRKENASENKVDSAKAEDTHSSSARSASNEKQDSAQNETKVEQSGKPLPQEGEQELAEEEEQQLDPLFLFAMGAMTAENTETSTAVNTSASNPKGELLLSGSRVNLQQASGLIDAESELQADDDAAELSSKVLKLEGSASAEKAVQLNSASGKVAELLVEKTAPDKNNAAALTESLKTAPDTLLNHKAVTATEAIRSDFQPRQESLLAAQQVRQVPGAAISMQQPGWSQQVTDKVMWMSSQNLRSAEIKLDPAELGRLEVKVSVGQEQTQVTFTSAHAGVRESLEGQMHRLREMLAQQGMQDVDVNVSDQSQQQQTQSDEQQASTGHSGARSVADNDDETVQHVTSLQEPHSGRLGLVDDYA